MFTALVMSVVVAPVFAGNATMGLSAQLPTQPGYGTVATFALTLTNSSNNTINNVGLKVEKVEPLPPADIVGATCTLSTGLPCTLSGPATASGYQLPRSGKLTITVTYNLPPAATPLPTFTLRVTGTSSNNSVGPNPAAYTTVSMDFPVVFAPPPPAYPSISVAMSHDAQSVLWSTESCTTSNDPDCGASYYGQYTVTVTSTGSDPVASAQPFELVVSSATGTFADSFGCVSPCAPPPLPLPSPPQASAKFKIVGLAPGASTEFTVYFKSPKKPSTPPALPPLDVTAIATIGESLVPPVTPVHQLATGSDSIAISDVATTYSSFVPPGTGGSAKAKNFSNPDPLNQSGPFTSRVDVPKYTKGAGNPPIKTALVLTPETTSCSPSSPQCLDSQVDVTVNGNAVDFGGQSLPLPALNGTDFLVINMVRDWTTLYKKPSSVFNAVVLYSDPSRGIYRELIKDCSKVDLRVVERCIYQRIDATKSAKGELYDGYIKFVIWARHNGVWSW